MLVRRLNVVILTQIFPNGFGSIQIGFDPEALNGLATVLIFIQQISILLKKQENNYIFKKSAA